MIDYTKTNTNDCGGLTLAEAKRSARAWARQDGQGAIGYVVKAAGRLHPTTDADDLARRYGERFEGIVWQTR